MRGNGIKHTTTTTGTGALSLSAVSGWPAYDDVFGTSGNRLVAYTVLDSNGVPIESGIGTITLSTLSLARTRVHFTWDGSTYSTANSALSLASGTKEVICSPAVEELIPAAAPFVTSAGASFGIAPLIFGNFYNHQGLTSGEIIYQPILMLSHVRAAQMTLRVNDAYSGGTSTVEGAVYEVGTNGLPGKQIVGFGTIGSLSSNVAIQNTALSTPVVIPAGVSYLALRATFSGGSGSPTVVGYNNLTTIGPLGGFSSPQFIYTTARVTGSLTDPATITSPTYYSEFRQIYVAFS